MSVKSDLYQILKERGELSRSYQDYTVTQLREELAGLGVDPDSVVSEEVVVPEDLPQKPADPEEFAGQRQNTGDGPIRVDENGLIWYQEEVRKPAYPKPRGRRVLTYLDTGVVKQTVQNGEYVETFEVPGSGPGRPTEVKITLPSYQVGIYKDPRLPFKIHVYNEQRGFNFFEVNEYYKGVEFVPPSIKRIYVENELCYDIRSTVLAIEAEYAHLQRMGVMK